MKNKLTFYDKFVQPVLLTISIATAIWFTAITVAALLLAFNII